ncbi:MAG: TRAP transporter large permease subunit [Pseudomonadota bacterium]
MAESLEILFFITTCAVLLLGFPVAFTLGGVALVFAFLGDAFGVFSLRSLAFYPQRIFGLMSSEVLVAVPLFIFMGLMLERSKVAQDLLTSMASLFGKTRGGLLFAVTAVGALMAASTGIVGATVVTMGLLSLPVMLKHGYDPKIATGSICAAGTLGQIIPPSIVLVFLGDIMTYANQQANLETGNVTGRTVSVGDLFAGALLPGLMLVGLYLAWQAFVAWRRPAACPALPTDALGNEGDQPRWRLLLGALVAPTALIVAVLGSILGGVATPTEAAGVGAVGALFLAAARLSPLGNRLVLAAVAAAIALLILNGITDLRLGGEETGPMVWIALALSGLLMAVVLVSIGITWRAKILWDVTWQTARITAMVFAVVIGASLFSLTFRGLGGEETVRAFLSGLPGGLTGAMLLVMVIMFVMGFFLDFLEIIFIVVPIVCPILIVMGADPIWLGVMIAVNLQTSFLTPPFGFALFFLRGVAPKEVQTLQIYKGVIPFVTIQLLALTLLALFPEIGTWLPRTLYG